MIIFLRTIKGHRYIVLNRGAARPHERHASGARFGRTQTSTNLCDSEANILAV